MSVLALLLIGGGLLGLLALGIYSLVVYIRDKREVDRMVAWIGQYEQAMPKLLNSPRAAACLERVAAIDGLPAAENITLLNGYYDELRKLYPPELQAQDPKMENPELCIQQAIDWLAEPNNLEPDYEVVRARYLADCKSIERVSAKVMDAIEREGLCDKNDGNDCSGGS